MRKYKTRKREAVSELLFNLANTSFGGAVVGVIVSLAVEADRVSPLNSIVVVILGIIMTIIFSSVGCACLKERKNI